MRPLDLVRFSGAALLAHRQRSLLTVLAIVVGIVSVVLLTAVGEGVRVFVVAEFTQFGTNLLAVTPGKKTTLGVSGATISTVRPLTLDDARALERLPGVVAVSPVVQGNAGVEFAGRERRTTVLGVGAAVPEVWRMPVAVGRFLPDEGYRRSRAFAVLGARMRSELFGPTNPLGRRIRAGGDRFRVIGVMAGKGQMLGFDLDDTLFIPVNRALEMFDRESVMEIDVLYAPEVSAERIAARVTRLLVARHGREDFTVITQDQMLEVLGNVLGLLTLGVAAIGAISLVVGAIGILTIMTIAVSERVSEIGLLAAVGATRGQVLRIFLLEAVALSAVGGGSGAGLALVAAGGLGVLAPRLPVEVTPLYVGLAVVLAVLIGLLAGVGPALRAARLKPLDALRAE